MPNTSLSVWNDDWRVATTTKHLQVIVLRVTTREAKPAPAERPSDTTDG